MTLSKEQRELDIEKRIQLRRYVKHVGLTYFHYMPPKVMYERFINYLSARHINLDISLKYFTSFITRSFAVEVSSNIRMFNRRLQMFVVRKEETNKMTYQKRVGLTISYITYKGIDNIHDVQIEEVYQQYVKFFKQHGYGDIVYKIHPFISLVINTLPLVAEYKQEKGFTFLRS